VGDSGQALAWRQRLLATQQAANGGSTGSTEEQRRTLDGMVELQVKSDDLRGALASLDRLVQLDSLNRYTYYRRIVQVADLADDRAARIRGLEGMVRANPADLESLTSLAELLLGGGSPSAAGRWIDQGLKAAPRNGHLQLLRGDLLVMQGADEEAIAAFERAKADPSWRNIAQQRIWQLRPPETAEERLKREFFGAGKAAATDDTTRK
jgi:tetratricopeptide (TPR) repeat protein